MKCPPRKPPGPKNSRVELSLELKVYVEMLQGYNEKDGMVITSTVRTISSVQKIIGVTHLSRTIGEREKKVQICG